MLLGLFKPYKALFKVMLQSAVMPTYVPEYVSLTSLPGCPRHSQMPIYPSNSIEQYSKAPRINPVPLPSLGTTMANSIPPPDFYPLIISSDLSTVQLSELQNIILISPIHIHAPLVHIGTILGRMPGERFRALEIFSHFQATTSQKLDYHVTYSQLSALMKTEVERTFVRRRGRGSDAIISWQEFIAGRSPCGGPLWNDLLLGNTSIWGFEPYSIGGYSVVHLAI